MTPQWPCPAGGWGEVRALLESCLRHRSRSSRGPQLRTGFGSTGFRGKAFHHPWEAAGEWDIVLGYIVGVCSYKAWLGGAGPPLTWDHWAPGLHSGCCGQEHSPGQCRGRW